MVFGTSGPHFCAPWVSFKPFSLLFQSLSALFVSLFFLASLCYLPSYTSLLSSVVSLQNALVSLLASRFSSISPAARRFSRSDWDPPPPAWQGNRACEIGVRLRQIELRGTPHLPPTPPSWPRAGHVLPHSCSPRCHPRASDGLQNAVLEPPMASRSPNYANVCKNKLNSANLC